MSETARLASVEPIGETQPVVKSVRMFGKLSGSSIWSALIKLSDGSESWYGGLPSAFNFGFCSSSGLFSSIFTVVQLSLNFTSEDCECSC